MEKISRRSFLRLAGRYAPLAAISSVLLQALTGCKAVDTVAKVGADLGVASGLIDSQQAESIQKSAKAVARTFEDITPEQEYYIGRTVGAVILEQYKPYKNPKAEGFINLMGQTVAQASDRPETFGGYHFLLLDSREINAFAAPGGLIFITRGMLRCCGSEDAAAAVLAHEVAHVARKHGLQAIKKSRVNDALTTIAMESAKSFGPRELASLTETFEGAISDVTATLVNNGYSRVLEKEADEAAVANLQRVGYDPNGLTQMLRAMEERLQPGGLDFAKTHPPPESRIADIVKIIGPYKPVPILEARRRRFSSALGNI